MPWERRHFPEGPLDAMNSKVCITFPCLTMDNLALGTKDILKHESNYTTLQKCYILGEKAEKEHSR